MFVQCHDVVLRLSKDSVNHLLASDIKILRSHAQKVRISTIFRDTRRHFRGFSVIIRDEMALQICLCGATMCN
jgi:hypothetical protein